MNPKVFPQLSKQLKEMIGTEEIMERRVADLVEEGATAAYKDEYCKLWKTYVTFKEVKDAEKADKLFVWSLKWLTQNIVSNKKA